ncbi:Uroporphyrin-III C/tetrapyrrole (Corrin/Porphyrin) methyltransferase [gamma proteobacterium HdN1]|nr:Uroporphyrin-III C/tetrapyrrole (Corrin/Porphyrin) methyltransferase [gamma proteobacterium HdN1]
MATPIGNLDDSTIRAIEVLKQVDLVAAEDTRHSQYLLSHFGIRKPMLSLHDHNEEARIVVVCAALAEGRSIALISDAGTPLISDPGFRVVRAVRAAGFRVVPIPGACAAIVALSSSGLPSDRFLFVGFAPARSQARKTLFEEYVRRPETLIFYESPRRVADFFEDAEAVFGGQRRACIAKELTKLHERIVDGTLSEIKRLLMEPAMQRGEFVIVMGGYEKPARDGVDEALGAAAGLVDLDQALRTVNRYLPPKQACALVADLYAVDKKALYQRWVDRNSGA